MGFKINISNEESTLCTTCEHSHIQTFHDGKRQITCTAVYPNIPMNKPVAQCNSYLDANQPTKSELEKIAWVLVTDKSKKAGFMPWKEFNQQARQEQLDD